MHMLEDRQLMRNLKKKLKRPRARNESPNGPRKKKIQTALKKIQTALK